MIFSASLILGFAAVTIARKAVIEKIRIHLTEKAADTAEIIDGRIDAFFQFIYGISRLPEIQSHSVSYQEKMEKLSQEVEFNEDICELYIVDAQGIQHNPDGLDEDYGDELWFNEALIKKTYSAEPYIDETRDNALLATFSILVNDNKGSIIGVLGVDVEGCWLTDLIKDIVVGKTGECYILGTTGTAIAHKNFENVQKRINMIEAGKDRKDLESLKSFMEKALSAAQSEIGYYDYDGKTFIASSARLKTTGWTVIIKAPVDEFLGTIHVLTKSMWIIGSAIVLVTMILVYFIAAKISAPLTDITSALKDIAQGDGDLTVRLKPVGNDEITELAEYFNQTIEKINFSVKNIGENAGIMQNCGEELSSNMTETASAINQINSNIEGVKNQSLTQAASVTETAGTMEEIIRTIEQLNESIAHQSSSVIQSSASIEQMVSGIAAITQTLEKADEIIKNLSSATSEGKLTLQASALTTQKIAEESGGLIEASNVIRNIAEQTNLLAMNAAIEAAHAGESGKGFAVVADEIRKLAEESSSHGKIITDTLKNLSEEISGLALSSKTVEEKFNAIFALSENVRNMSAELTGAMREQENGSREVLEAIKDISRITGEVKNGSEEMLIGGKSVSGEMQKLDRLTIEIKDSMNEMSAGVMQINEAVHEVNCLAQENKESIVNLAGEVKKFKT